MLTLESIIISSMSLEIKYNENIYGEYIFCLWITLAWNAKPFPVFFDERANKEMLEILRRWLQKCLVAER